MTRRQRLDDDGVAKLPPKAKRYTFSDPELPGHYVRVNSSGEKSFCAVTRDARGKQIWRMFGNPGTMSIDDSRDLARKFIRGAREASADSFQGVAENWFKRHVTEKKLRSAGMYRHYLDLIYPHIGDREFSSVRRSDIARVLDAIEDASGKRAADYALTVIRLVCNFHAQRNDHYTSPVIKGMTRYAKKENEGDRILTDDELRKVWTAAGEMGSFGRLVRFALLTGQRRDKLAAMKWADLDGKVWKIKAAPREKNHGGELELPRLALDVIGRAGDGLVFPTPGGKKQTDWTENRKRLEKASDVTGWTIHDLRRTARSLMSRAGVQPHIAELTLGHVQRGVQAIYDRHSYTEEKAIALRQLADLIDGVLNPSKARGKVVRLKTA
jgi:integrase